MTAPQGADAPPSLKGIAAEVWPIVRDSVCGKVERIGEVVTSMEAGSSTPAERADARVLAHQLAGSLGTFGFQDASVAARDLETVLDAPTPVATLAVDALARVRDALDL